MKSLIFVANDLETVLVGRGRHLLAYCALYEKGLLR